MILLTGGAGYIGSNMLLTLLNKQHNVLVLDNLSAGNKAAFDHACKLSCGRGQAHFIEADIRQPDALHSIFAHNPIDTVLHFAGKKSIGESVANPLSYYENNVLGSINILNAMAAFNVKKLLFSSTTSVYGQTNNMPLNECSVVAPNNPYSQSKAVIDTLLQQMAASDGSLRLASMRYANPIGACDPMLADNSQDNLLPAMERVKRRECEYLSIYGGDYHTIDGTAVRDYIHVADVVRAHVLALDYLANNAGYHLWNISQGKGYSVKQMVALFEQVHGQSIPYQYRPRRQGDAPAFYASYDKIQAQTGWQPIHTISDALASVAHPQTTSLKLSTID